MAQRSNQLNRRAFLKHSAALGAGAVVGSYFYRNASAASRDRITLYQNTGADSINPYNQSSGSIYGNWQHVIEPLIELDYAKKAWVGVLAESWEFQGKRWVFKLKRGIMFHNGAPLTSKDVVFSVENMRDEKGGSLQASNFNDVTEIQTPDDQTVIFVTKQPLAIFLDRSRKFHPQQSRRRQLRRSVVSKFSRHRPLQVCQLPARRQHGFHPQRRLLGRQRAIKEVVFRKVTEDAARLAALESGQADFINAVPVHEVARLERHPRVRVDKIEGLEMYFLMMNVAHKPFDNKLVRQAANYSVDAPAIVKNIFDGIGYPVNGPVGPRVIGADPKLNRYPYDPKKAKDLLAQAGYAQGCDVQLYYSAGRYPKDREVCQAVAAQMVKGGFRVELISPGMGLCSGGRKA